MQKTSIYLVLDKSASMKGKLAETIAAVNEFLYDQQDKKDGEDIEVSCYLFDQKVENLYRSLPIDNPDVFLNENNYKIGGFTALYDAVNAAMTDCLQAKESSGLSLIVVMTDGEENSSKVGISEVQSKMKELEQSGVMFVYLGADQNAWEAASRMGYKNNATMSYSGDRGTRSAFKSVSDKFSDIRERHIVANSTSFGPDSDVVAQVDFYFDANDYAAQAAFGVSNAQANLDDRPKESRKSS